MKNWLPLLFIVSSLSLTSCGDSPKGQNDSELNNSKITLNPYEDISYPSTLNLAELTDVPTEINLREKMTPIKRQDARGTCSFFATIALFESAIKTQMKVDVNLSEEYLNYVTKSTGYFSSEEGSFPDTNVYAMVKSKTGLLLESDWPYQPIWFGNKVPCLDALPSDKNAPKECFSHNAPSEKIKEKTISLENFEGTVFEPKTTNELIREIATSQLPMTINLPVNERGWSKDGQVVYTNSMREECLSSPSVCGRHAVVVTGYNLKKKVFYIRNSWGTDWGDAGYGEVSFDMVDRFAERNYVKIWLTKDIDLPEARDNTIAINQFEVKNSFDASTDLVVEVKSNLENVNSHTIAYATSIVELKEGSTVASDETTKMVELTDDEAIELQNNRISASELKFVSEDQSSLNSDLKLKITKKQLGVETLRNKIKTNASKLFLRTTVYNYTDNEAFKVLKRVYTPVF